MILSSKIKQQIADYKLTDSYFESQLSKRLVLELEYMLNAGFLESQIVCPSTINFCNNEIYVEWNLKEGRTAFVKISLYLTYSLPKMEFYLPHPIYSDLDHMNVEVQSIYFFDFINKYKGYVIDNAD